ncbi:MAG: UPF0280 family protein [Desulfamplus sp.]|nr:UPF0280 family protein [Desulfamplus sp.]
MFSNRYYRTISSRRGLVSFIVTVKETDLHIQACSDMSDAALREVLKQRGHVEAYIDMVPVFRTSLTPILQESYTPPAPAIVAQMLDASRRTGVGPMAAIAGAISQFTGNELLKSSSEVIVENGGDIFFKTHSHISIAVFAGQSRLSMKIGVRIAPRTSPAGLCTSSGTVGHSTSFGKADAVTVLSSSAVLADAAATAIANLVQTREDIEPALERGRNIKGVEGILIIKGDQLGAWGDIELVSISP